MFLGVLCNIMLLFDVFIKMESDFGFEDIVDGYFVFLGRMWLGVSEVVKR